MSKDALRLFYDKPVDRIAARLLYKQPDFHKLPEKARDDLMIEPPRIKPEDITFIFGKAPRNKRGCEQPQDRRGQLCGVYLILGHAGSRDVSEKKRFVRGGRPLRTPQLWAGGHYGMRRGPEIRTERVHYWWVREPDGTVSAIKWAILRRLLPGETVEMAARRRYIAKHAVQGENLD